ncbi:MAG: allantoicase [Alphaproteobacteria bacterium]|nr:allantoicase [Alphaproteobacteria bacterium]
MDVIPSKIPENLPEYATRYIDLGHPRLGTKPVFTTDDWFAPVERMLNPEPAVFITDKYDDNGKWMDGWESRRKRFSGYDYSIVKLGFSSIIKGFCLDTSHFTGNFAPAASIEACISDQDIPEENASWTELVPTTDLKGNDHCFVQVDSDVAWTHIRLNIFPDGGLARLRIYGMPSIDWSKRDKSELVDLAATVNGGRAISWSDAHFGVPSNLLAPGRGVNMGDGWETARRRVPGFDWCILALGHKGLIEEIEIDTAHFKGNFAYKCSIHAANVSFGTEDTLATQSMFWEELLPETELDMDQIFTFAKDKLNDLGPITHIRLNIFPDGGISRIRLRGKPVE